MHICGPVLTISALSSQTTQKTHTSGTVNLSFSLFNLFNNKLSEKASENNYNATGFFFCHLKEGNTFTQKYIFILFFRCGKVGRKEGSLRSTRPKGNRTE